jgi:hypothetical protein
LPSLLDILCRARVEIVSRSNEAIAELRGAGGLSRIPSATMAPDAKWWCAGLNLGQGTNQKGTGAT